jgi:8-oxo-dGTP pyrophosphatase MutT (NUDIX family)
MHAVPRTASTVIVFNQNLEVLLMQRSTHDSFMAHASVYPGGAVDESDADDSLLKFCRNFDVNKAKALFKNNDMDERAAFGLFFAAIRELFEESSILLAVKSSGEPLEKPDLERLHHHRSKIHEKEMTLTELAEIEGLIYTPEALVPFAHWITPVFQKKRFDTWFFLAGLPKGQSAYQDNNELTSALWIKPEAALQMNDTREILLMPPTLMTLRELASFSSIEVLFSHASAKDIPTVQPEGFNDGSRMGVILPNDPDYADISLRQPCKPGEPSRVILDNGYWKTSSDG